MGRARTPAAPQSSRNQVNVVHVSSFGRVTIKIGEKRGWYGYVVDVFRNYYQDEQGAFN